MKTEKLRILTIIFGAMVSTPQASAEEISLNGEIYYGDFYSSSKAVEPFTWFTDGGGSEYDIFVGQSGFGEITIPEGESLAGGFHVLGRSSYGAHGVYNIDGVLTGRHILGGSPGRAQVKIGPTGYVSVGGFELGTEGASQGFLRIEGFCRVNGTCSVGSSGTGEAIIEKGGTLHANKIFLGYSGSGEGYLQVFGNLICNTDYLYAQNGGVTLTIEESGTFEGRGLVLERGQANILGNMSISHALATGAEQGSTNISDLHFGPNSTVSCGGNMRLGLRSGSIRNTTIAEGNLSVQGDLSVGSNSPADLHLTGDCKAVARRLAIYPSGELYLMDQALLKLSGNSPVLSSISGKLFLDGGVLAISPDGLSSSNAVDTLLNNVEFYVKDIDDNWRLASSQDLHICIGTEELEGWWILSAVAVASRYIDSDHDGMNDLAENFLGTDRFDPLSRLQLSPKWSQDLVTITPYRQDRTYELWLSDDLVNWTYSDSIIAPDLASNSATIKPVESFRLGDGLMILKVVVSE